jgi:phosphoenolpyruvate synthase/pyruvate phosphate dikinase
MALILPLEKMTPEDQGRLGGKCYAIAVVARNGMNVPEALCVCAEGYEAVERVPSAAFGFIPRHSTYRKYASFLGILPALHLELLEQPPTASFLSGCYEAFVSWNGLRERILLELSRKAGNVWTNGPVDDPPGRRI